MRRSGRWGDGPTTGRWLRRMRAGEGDSTECGACLMARPRIGVCVALCGWLKAGRGGGNLDRLRLCVLDEGARVDNHDVGIWRQGMGQPLGRSRGDAWTF